MWRTVLILSLDWTRRQSDTLPLLDPVPVVAIVWTAGIALYLVYTWLRRPDERRLVLELEAVYPAVDESARPAPFECRTAFRTLLGG